jgi:DNA polymerase-1
MAEELRLQLPHIQRLACLMDCGVVQRRGVEADDLIAAHATCEAAAGNRVTIASSDKDFAQLVCGAITLLNPPPQKSFSADWVVLDYFAVEKKFSVAPGQIVDYLCLVGDASDNVRGVPRIGAKTAANLLRTYGSIDGIVEHLDELPKGIAENILNHSGEIARNRKLIAFDVDAAAVQPVRNDFNIDALVSFFEEFSMQRFIGKAIRRYGAKRQRDDCQTAKRAAQECFPF